MAQKESFKMGHRGPDERGVYTAPVHQRTLCHERLSINDLTTGRQPLKGCSGAHLIHNGEIYNHHQLWDGLKSTHTHCSESDSEIILHLWEEMGEQCVSLLDGVFAFILLDGAKVFVARDPIGVKPLYYGIDEDGDLWFASETKSLVGPCEKIEEFPPGHYYTLESGFVKYYTPKWKEAPEDIPSAGADKIRASLEASVRKRLMSDVPLGVLLSGGLDSSLVSSIVAREMKGSEAKVKSFSVGVSKDAHDMVAARKVADFIGTEHHDVVFSVEQGIEHIKETILKIETYDVTTIRCSIPMLIMSKYIKDQGVKVVLSGEGADEIFGGYLYFNEAPCPAEFPKECVRRIDFLHKSDVLRADRATMGAGVEARVPFLDLDFLKDSMEVDPRLKESKFGSRIEKYVLRKAFDTPQSPYLPDSILWRQKEQFQDGVGYSWVDGLKEYCEQAITDGEFKRRHLFYPHNTPRTKEAFLYRKIFEELFDHHEATKLTQKWIPKWQEHDEDPSGRASKYHKKSHHTQEEESEEEIEVLAI